MNKGFTITEVSSSIVICLIANSMFMIGQHGITISANEKSAITSLQIIGSAEETFKKEDIDGNGISDYFVGDVQGLYIIRIGGAGSELAKKIDQALAEADGAPQAAYAAGIQVDATVLKAFTARQPLNGYWFRQLAQREDASGTAQAIDSDGNDRDLSVFAVIAYPHLYGSTGKRTFIKGLDQSVYYRDTGSETAVLGERPPDTVPHGALVAPFNVYPFNKETSGWDAVKEYTAIVGSEYIDESIMENDIHKNIGGRWKISKGVTKHLSNTDMPWGEYTDSIVIEITTDNEVLDDLPDNTKKALLEYRKTYAYNLISFGYFNKSLSNAGSGVIEDKRAFIILNKLNVNELITYKYSANRKTIAMVQNSELTLVHGVDKTKDLLIINDKTNKKIFALERVKK